jgi:hypothetical protein
VAKTDILKHLLLSSMISFLVFLMINVAFAQLLLSTLLQAIDGNTALTTIVFLGFGVATLVALGVNLLITKNKRPGVAAAALALGTNLLLWTCISYLFILRQYPGIIAIPNTGSLLGDIIFRALAYLGAIPRVMAYYAIYILDNITIFWIYSLFSYSGWYGLFFSTLTTNRS